MILLQLILIYLYAILIGKKMTFEEEKHFTHTPFYGSVDPSYRRVSANHFTYYST